MEMDSMKKGTLLTQLADFYANISERDIPNSTIEKCKRTLADFLGVLAGGYQIGGFCLELLAWVKELGGKEETTILCDHSRVPAVHAAMVMGAMGHSIELDDGHRWGTSHPAVAVIPAVISLGEKIGSSFSDLLVSIIIGYDVMLRVARAINPAHLRRGFHSTGTCGSLGAAAGCSYLLRLSAEKFAYAISIAGLQSAGIQEMLHDHPGIKPLQPGKAAFAGVLSSELASKGSRSPRTLFEGSHGWFRAMCNGEYSEHALMEDLGKRWEIEYTYTKLYPTCRHIHAAVDLAREARLELGITGKEVERVLVKTYRLGISEVGQVIEPMTKEEAMFSLPFSVALALSRGAVVLHDYTNDVLFDKELRRIASIVHIEEDESMNEKYPEERGASICVDLFDGRCFMKKIPFAKGEPENPISDREFVDKLVSILSPYYPSDFSQGIWDLCVASKVGGISYTQIVEHFGRFHRK